jgi:hypothetical protein
MAEDKLTAKEEREANERAARTAPEPVEANRVDVPERTYVEVSKVKDAINLARRKAEDALDAASRGVRTEEPVLGADRLVDQEDKARQFKGVVEDDATGVRVTVTVTVAAK